MQRASVRANEGRAPEERILLCVGIGYGAMLRIGDDDVFGAEVNAASKLGEDTAGAGEILVTEGARAAAGVMKDLTYEPLDAVVPGAGACWRVHWALER
jgi:class 3 adenylate cyclase